jgi:hypothetical protein
MIILALALVIMADRRRLPVLEGELALKGLSISNQW